MKDGKTTLGLRILALCSAVGLGCTYVGWQQKQAAPHVDKSGPRTVLSGSKSKVVAPAEFKFDNQEKPDRTLMPGSKSGNLHLPPQAEVNESKQEHSPRRAHDFLRPPQAEANELKQEKTAPNRTLLPGSKSIDAILRPRDVAPPAEPKAAEP